MKKLMLTALVISTFNFSVTFAETKAETKTVAQSAQKTTHTKNENLVSIDSLSLFQKSIEGQKFTEQMQEKIKEFQTFVQKSQEELTNMQQELQKKAAILDPKVIQEKNEEIALLRKRKERELTDREEALRAEIQKNQMEIRERQLQAANEFFDQKNWDMMVDRQTPGLLFVKKTIDQTDAVLKVVDQKYLASVETKKKAAPQQLSA